jgi:hypothetical protein
MSHRNTEGDVVFRGMGLFFIASVLVTLFTGMWLHWPFVGGAFLVTGHMADSASKRRIHGAGQKRRHR